MKILVVGDFMNGSGLTNYLINTYKYFDEENFEIEYLSYSNSQSMDEYFQNSETVLYKVHSITKSPVMYLLDWLSFLKKHRIAYDAIHFNYSATWNFIPVYLFGKFSRSKIVIHSHNNYYSKSPSTFMSKFFLDSLNNFGRLVFNKFADKKIAVSVDSASWMFGGIKDVLIAKNGIDIDKFEYNDKLRKRIRKSMGFSDNDLVLGFVGRLEERKNPKFCLEILKRLRESKINARLLIIGDGILMDQLKEYVRENKIDNICYFLGNLDEVSDWYSAMDIFLFPSITEGFGFVLLEAQASGLRVLSSDLVPKEAKVTNSVKNISINNIDIWLDNISTYKHKDDYREKESNRNCEEINDKGFSIVSSSLKLEQELIEVIRGDK